MLRKCISFLGTVNLYKTSVEAIPIYSMSIYKLPKGMVDVMEKMRKDGKRKLSNMARLSLLPKGYGGT